MIHAEVLDADYQFDCDTVSNQCLASFDLDPCQWSDRNPC